MFVAVCDQNFGNSTFALLEGGPVLAGDDRVAELPLDLVERIAARDREEPPRRDARRLVDDHVLELAPRRALRARLPVPALRSPCFLPSRSYDISKIRFGRPRTLSGAAERIADVRESVGRNSQFVLAKILQIAEKRRTMIPDRESRRDRRPSEARFEAGRRNAARLEAPGQVPGRAGGDEQEREPAEDEQRHRHRVGARGVERADAGFGAAVVSRLRSARRAVVRLRPVAVPGVVAGGVVAASSSPASGRWSPAAQACRSACLERARDVVLGARVVADVARQDLDRVVVAVERDSVPSTRPSSYQSSITFLPHDSAAAAEPAPSEPRRASATRAGRAHGERAARRDGVWLREGVVKMELLRRCTRRLESWRVSRTA